MIPWAGDILTKPCRDRFFIQIYFSSLALNLTRGQATKYDRNKLHKVTFVAQNYIFVLFFSDGFSIGEVRWSLGNCVGDLPRWVFLRRLVPEDCRIDRSDTDGTDNGGATYFLYLKFSRRRMAFVSIKWQNFETVPLISAKNKDSLPLQYVCDCNAHTSPFTLKIFERYYSIS